MGIAKYLIISSSDYWSVRLEHQLSGGKGVIGNMSGDMENGMRMVIK